MSRNWGIFLIFVGILLIAAPWLAPIFSHLPECLGLLLSIILQHKPVLQKIFPASLILLGFAVLTGGFLRKTLILLAIAVAFLSLAATVLPGYSVSASEKIEFFAGDMVVVWDEEAKEWKGSLDGLEVFKAKDLRIEFFAGSVKVFLPEKDVDVKIEGGVGEVKIFAPDSVRVKVDGDLGIGSFRNNHLAINPKHTARIAYSLGIGEVRIE